MKKLFFALALLLWAVSANAAVERPQWITDYFAAVDSHETERADSIFNANFNRANSDGCYVNGCRQMNRGHYDYAIGWFEEALKVYSPANYYWKSTIYGKLAEVYNHLDRQQDALDCLIKAKDDDYDNHYDEADTDDDWTEIAEQYEAMELYAKAEDVYYHLIDIDENNSEAKINLAYLYMVNAPDEDEAMLDSLAYDLLCEVIRNNESNSDAYYARAQYNQYINQDYRAAIDDYLLCIYYDKDYTTITKFYTCARLDPQYAIRAINRWVKDCASKEKREKTKYDFIRYRARVYEDNAYYQEAIEDYTEAMEDDPEGTNKLWALYNRGDCYYHIYDYQHAVDDYTSFIQLDDDFDDDVYLQRAMAYFEMGKYEEASRDYTAVIKSSTNDFNVGNACFNRGWIKEIQHDDYGALRDYSRCLEVDTLHSFAYVMRGKTFQRIGNPSRARQDFEQVLRFDTVALGDSRRHYALAFLGDTTAAVAWMNRIIESDPGNAGNYYDAACLYALMGSQQQSLFYLQRAFEMGYRNIVHVKSDSDLDAIRSTPEYAALIEKYEAQASTQQIEELLKEERQRMTEKDKLDLIRDFKLSE